MSSVKVSSLSGGMWARELEYHKKDIRIESQTGQSTLQGLVQPRRVWMLWPILEKVHCSRHLLGAPPHPAFPFFFQRPLGSLSSQSVHLTPSYRNWFGNRHFRPRRSRKYSLEVLGKELPSSLIYRSYQTEKEGVS